MHLLLIVFVSLSAQAIDTLKLIERTEQQSMGKSFSGRLRMTVEREGRSHELEVLSWTEGRDKALVKVLKPAKDRGTGNLRLEFNLWQYLPKIERTIKVPPSLMFQNWMGSDFTNDDLVKTSRLSRDYDCKFAKDETLAGTQTVNLICLPKPNAPVVWGKVLIWIDPNKATLLKQCFFNENGEQIKEMLGSNVKTIDGHTFASQLKMRTVKTSTTTTLDYLEAKFDQSIAAKIFSQSFLQEPIKE